MRMRTLVGRWIRRWQNWLAASCLLFAGDRRYSLLAARTIIETRRHLDGRLRRLTAICLRLTLAPDDRYRMWVPLSEMPPALVQGVMLHEDAWFRWHPGFNPISLARGGWITYIRGGNRQGGSTITMQLARLAYHLNTRTPGGKLRQMLRAIELELCYSKNEILEAYLNYAPYGRNIEGAGAASLIYFDKPVTQLSLPEALTLAVIPQDPSRRVRDSDRRASDVIGSRLDASARIGLFKRWVAKHPADAEMSSLMRLPLRLRSPEHLPFAAPHFVEEVLADQRLRMQAPSPEIRTTLESRIAARARTPGCRSHRAQFRSRHPQCRCARHRHARHGHQGTGRIGRLQECGNPGQVNGALAKRSPGSALKPFIYALGFDQGVLHPQTVLRDVPTAFGPFTPENFDGRFLGPVTATEALIRSRNIPAVYVASKLQNPIFYDFLKNAGISRMAIAGSLRPRARARRRRSHARGTRHAVRDARQSRHADAAAQARRRSARAGRTHAQRRSELHGARHAAPESASRRRDDRATRRVFPCTGKPARRGDFAMRGRRASSVRTSWSCGSAISTAQAIRRSSASKRRRRCSSTSPMRCARAIRRCANRRTRRRRISSACRSASPAAICRTRGVRREGPRGSFRASRRFA